MNRRAITTLLVAGTLATAVSAAVPASAATTFTQLSSTVKSVTTNTGAKLHLMINAFQGSASSSKTSVTVSLGTGTLAVTGETHTWTIPVSHSALVYKSSTGKATLKTGSQMSPYGSLSLTFTRISSKTTSCSGGHTTTITGKLSGIVHFVTGTGSHGWGAVGSSTQSMSFSTPNHLTVISGCPVGIGFQGPCSNFTSWSAPSSGATFVSGISTRAGGTTTTTITADRSKALSTPSGSSRSDVLVVSAPPPTFNGGTLTITTKAGSAITGSATITNTTGSSSAFKCKLNGVIHNAQSTAYTGSWSTSGLVAHFKVTGNASAPKSGNGSFDVASYS